jgi:hypothetical protein
VYGFRDTYERPTAAARRDVNLAGYEHHDAVGIAVNVIRFSLLQNSSDAGKIN